MTSLAEAVAFLKFYGERDFGDETVAAYMALLKDAPEEAVVAAIWLLCKESKWRPMPSEILDVVASGMVGEPGAPGAWATLLRRWGSRDGMGDTSIELSPLTRAAVEACGLQPYALWTTTSLHSLRREFVEAYSMMLRQRIRAEKFSPADQAQISRAIDAAPARVIENVLRDMP